MSSNTTGTIHRYALADAPASGATKTLFDSTVAFPQRGLGTNIQRIDVTIYASHDSAASGLVFYASMNHGTNWRQDDAQSYTTASGVMTFSYPRESDDVKVTYQNSANTLTAFEVEVRYSYDRTPAV